MTDKGERSGAVACVHPEPESGMRDEASCPGRSDSRFRNLAELLPAIVIEADLDLRVAFANEQACALTGYRRDEIECIDNVFDLVAADDRESARLAARRIRDGAELVTVEFEVRRRDGTSFPAICHVAPIKRNGKLRGYRSVLLDITARRYTEERLRMLGRAVIQSRDGILVTDMQGEIQYCNPAWARMHELSVRQVLGRDVGIFHSSEQNAKQIPAIRERVLEEGSWEGEIFHVRGDDVAFPTDTMITLLHDEHDQRLGFVWQTRDITGRREAERALCESERRLAILMSNLPGMAYRCLNNDDWTMVFVSEGCRRLTGYAPEELTGRGGIPYAELIHPDDRPKIRAAIAESIETGEPFRSQYRLFTACGDERWVWEQGVAVLDEQGGVEALEGFIADITDRVRAESELAQSEELMRALFAASPDGHALQEVVCDDAGNPVDLRFLEVNKGFCELTGLAAEEVVGRLVSEAIPGLEPDWIRKLGEVAITGVAADFEMEAAVLGRRYRTMALPAGKGRFATIFREA